MARKEANFSLYIRGLLTKARMDATGKYALNVRTYTSGAKEILAHGCIEMI